MATSDEHGAHRDGRATSAHPGITGPQFRATCEMLRHRILGGDIKPQRLADVGPAAWAVITRDSSGVRWRPDADLRLYELIAAAFHPSHVSDASVPLQRTRRAAVKHYGVSGFPVTLKDIALELGVHESTPRNDVNRYLENSAFLKATDQWLRSTIDGDLLAQDVPTFGDDWPWWTPTSRATAHIDWPPTQVRMDLLKALTSNDGLKLYPPPAMNAEELATQLSTASHVPLSPIRAPQNGLIGLRETWLLMRQTAAEMTLAYLSASAGSAAPSARAGNAYSSFHRYVAKRWSVEGPLPPGVPADHGDPIPESHGDWQRIACASLARSLWSLASGRHRVPFADRAREMHHLRPIAGGPALRDPIHPRLVVASKMTAFNQTATSATHDLDELVRVCDQTARTARAIKSLRGELIPQWLSIVTTQVRTHQHYDATTELEIAVQLQGLIWDVADAYEMPGMPQLFEKLLPARVPPNKLRDRKAGEAPNQTLTSIYELGADVGRASGVARRKGARPDWRRSRDAGLQAAGRWDDPRRLSRLGPLAWDLAQQDYLQQAGFYVSYLEDMLATRDPLNQPIELLPAATQALLWSTASMDLMMRLGPNLPVARWGDEQRLALRAWEINTRLIEMRALTAALVCLQSGMVGERAWAQSLADQPKSTLAHENHALLSTVDLLATLIERYTTTVDHPALASKDFGRLLTQAFAMLIVNNGRLPYMRPIDVEGPGRPIHFLEVLMNLSGSPITSESPSPWALLQELRTRNFQIGWLGRLSRQGRVWKYIGRSSPEVQAALLGWEP